MNQSQARLAPYASVRPFHPSVIAVHACDLSLRRCYAAAERTGSAAASALGYRKSAVKTLKKNIPFFAVAAVLRSPWGRMHAATTGMGILDEDGLVLHQRRRSYLLALDSA